jgi:hypothetical protein
VPPVGDLEGVGDTRVDALPADVRAVASDHLHARASPEPPRYGFGRVPFEEVRQDGARGVAFAQSEVVHAHHPHVLGFGTEGAADAVQEGVGAHEQAQ